MDQVLNSRILQILLLFPNLYVFLIVILALYSLFTDGWAGVAHNYGTNILLLCQSVSIPIAIWIFKDKVLRYIYLIENEALSLKSAGEDTFADIKRECTTLKRIALAMVGLTVLCSVSELAFEGDEEDWQYAIMLINQHFSGWWYKVVFILNESMCITFGYTTSIPVLITMYIICQIKFQFKLLNTYWEVLKNDKGLLDDSEYQERIFVQLKRCIRLHNYILRTTSKLTSDFPLATVGLVTVAMISFVSPAYFVLSNVSPQSNYRMYFILATCLLQEVLVCVCCQHMTDESYNVYLNALDCPWEAWDVRNQKTLLIILINSAQPIQTSKYGVPNASYGLILRNRELNNLSNELPHEPYLIKKSPITSLPPKTNLFLSFATYCIFIASVSIAMGVICEIWRAAYGLLALFYNVKDTILQD